MVIGLDDTIELRWGPRSAPASSIAARCGPKRRTSSKPAVLALCHVAGARAVGLTPLAPSKRFYDSKLRSPKTLLDWTRQLLGKSIAGRPIDRIGRRQRL